MNADDPAPLLFEPCLHDLPAMSDIGPDNGSGFALGDDIARPLPVEACRLGDAGLSDESEGPADPHAALAAVGGVGDVDPGLSAGGVLGIGELRRPACLGVLLPRLGGLIGPDVISGVALFDPILLGLEMTLLWGPPPRRRS